MKNHRQLKSNAKISRIFRTNPGEREFVLADLTPEEKNRVVEVFHQSYVQACGKAWSPHTFLSNARSWVFFGNLNPGFEGFVAVRPQRSGMLKLVAVAGSPRSVLAGIKLLTAAHGNEPIWGAVSGDLVGMCERFGLIAPHNRFGGPTIIRTLVGMIPAGILGISKPEIQSDGSFVVTVTEIGQVKKYFVANRPYFAFVSSGALDNVDFAGKALLKKFVSSFA